MEKELNCPTIFGMEISSEQLPNCYFQSNWDTSIDQNDPFESALSSMVSSPTAAASNGGDGMMIRELIGRLGSITDSGEISPQSCIATGNNSTNNSCYSTPLNSPPKINLSSLMMMGESGNFPKYPPNLATLNADPGFVERAAKFSCFGNNNFVGGELGMKNSSRPVPKLEAGKLSRVSSNPSIRVGGGGNVQIDVNSGVCEKKFGGISRALTPENGEMGDSREGSSVSQNDANSRKRKSIPKAKLKDVNSPAAKDEKVEAENEESNAKRSKHDDEDAKKKNAGEASNNNNDNNNNDNNNDKQNSDNNQDAAKPEPPKDYIHVRARRGQATDSHSLAERVRREKISERMKFLQDLVPGCNKVTGKATVLDEIINYVQSLQRQVEFLSMKLATVNPRMEFNMEAFLSKDMFQSRGGAVTETMYPLDQNSQEASPFGYQSSQQFPPPLQLENPYSLNPLNATRIRRNPGFQLPPMDGFCDSMNQVPIFWEDDLQSIVQMGIIQNQTQSGPGTIPNAQMKIEL